MQPPPLGRAPRGCHLESLGALSLYSSSHALLTLAAQERRLSKQQPSASWCCTCGHGGRDHSGLALQAKLSPQQTFHRVKSPSPDDRCSIQALLGRWLSREDLQSFSVDAVAQVCYSGHPFLHVANFSR